jgi:ComF family protein
MVPRGSLLRFAAAGRRARSGYAALLDLLFPPLCIQCRKPGSRFCGPCAADIDWIDSDRCRFCGLPLRGASIHACIDPATLQFIRSAAVFAGPVRRALHALKYDSDRGLAAQLVDLCAPHWTVAVEAYDRMIPVPLGRRRERDRGYNQSRLLADAISRRSGVPVETGALVRIRETKSQVGMSQGERRENVAGAFSAAGVEGKSILLVDDVCTTGATLQSCADALARAGAGRVGAITLARAILPGRT